MVTAAEPATNMVTYLPYSFGASEGWHVTGAGDHGTSQLDRATLHFDFSKGAGFIGIAPPDRCLLTRPQRFHLRVRGQAPGHSVYVTLRTHFMTSYKVVGQFTGAGEQELVFDAPPGDGWQWQGGENDGKIHGPLRVGEIRLQADGRNDTGTLEFLSLQVEGECPADKLAVLSARYATEGGRDSFQANIQWLGTTTTVAQLECSVRDWQRKVLSQSNRVVDLQPGAAPIVAEFPRPPRKDLNFMEAELSLQAPGQVIKTVQAYWLAPLPARSNVRLEPESPFGMGVYLGRFGREQMEQVARKAMEAGVKWSREDFSWQRIEPSPGHHDWTYYDALLDCAGRNGICVYAIVGYWASWSKSYTPEGIDQYVAFTRQLVKRYKDRIHQWEIWNEPNIFFWQGPKEMYAELLKKSYAAIKEEDPTAQVLGISTAGVDVKFIDKMQQLGAPFDVLTIHPYRSKFDDSGFIEELKKVSDQVRLPDGTRRPIWLTEIGWATHVPHHVLRQDFEPFTQRTQAELISRVYLCSIVSGIEPRTFWYDFRNDGTDPFYFEHNMGVMQQDGSPKPAYVAYATLSRVLEGLKFAGPVEVPPGNFGFRFTSGEGSRQVIALWNPKEPARVSVKLPAQPTKLVNSVGEETVLPEKRPAGNKALHMLPVDLQPGAPVYVLTGDT